MIKQWIRPFGVIMMVLLWVGCGAESALPPTLMPVAQLPQPTATSNLPPTLDINSRPTPETPPTAAPATPQPSATPQPVQPTINISSVDPYAALQMGTDVAVRGLIETNGAEQIVASLVTSNGRELAQVPGVLTDRGWEAILTIPPYVSGAAILRANLLDEAGNVLAEHEVPVLLALNKTLTDRYLELYRPQIADTAVGGYNIFFDGEVLQPAGNVIRISIWANDCQERVAQQTFTLGRSSRPVYWQGFVVAPKDLVGPVCAVASFGEPGAENWREAQVPIELLPQDSADARGVVIGNPRTGAEVYAGAEILLYGTAYNVTDGPVLVNVLMENGRIVGQTETTTDFWGYWEARILLPFDVLGLADITVTAGEDETLAETVLRVNVLPAPTPTPGP
jgi:hypothetical protein